MKNYFYSKTIWRVTLALLDYFNDLTIYRFDTDGNRVGTINVPITYGPVEKMQQTRQFDRQDDERYYLQLPRLALVMNGITFSPDRSYALNEEREWYAEANTLSAGSNLTDYQPTPYDYNYTLYVRTESMEDFAQIMENILPYFTPKNMLRIREFSYLNIERDLPVTLGGVNLDFTEDLDEESMRHVNASMDLIVEGWQYKPVTSASLVEVIQSRYFIGESELTYTSAGVPQILSASAQTSGFGTLQVDEYRTSGFFQSSAMPAPSYYESSGYNTNTSAYWTNTYTYTSGV